jgi:hypothetical protein
MKIGQEQDPADGQYGAAMLAMTTTMALAWLVTACSSRLPGGYASPTPSPAPPGGVAWLMSRRALSQVVVDAGVRQVLRGTRIYEILQPGQQPLEEVPADPVVTFASAARLEQVVASGQIPGGTYGVLYDPEAWSFTPLAEQRNPVAAAARAAAVAHAHGLRFIVAPALTLTSVLARGSRQSRWEAFLGLGLVGELAKVADIVEIQAQSLERHTATYAAFVRAATAQARQANPRVTVLAGLSTNPPGAPVNSSQLTSAVRATRSIVSGYWLNIPGRGPHCPTCNPPRPDIAIQVLRQLG